MPDTTLSVKGEPADDRGAKSPRTSLYGHGGDRRAGRGAARAAERARARGGGAAPDLRAEIGALVAREAAALSDAERAELSERVLLAATGLGPLEPLLADPAVDEVMVNGPGDVYVERHGKIRSAGVRFDSEAELAHAIERILAPLGRRVDE